MPQHHFLVLVCTHSCSRLLMFSAFSPSPRGQAEPSALHLLPELLNAFLLHFIFFLAYRHTQAPCLHTLASICLLLFCKAEAVPGFEHVSFPVTALPAVPSPASNARVLSHFSRPVSSVGGLKSGQCEGFLRNSGLECVTGSAFCQPVLLWAVTSLVQPSRPACGWGCAGGSGLVR